MFQLKIIVTSGIKRVKMRAPPNGEDGGTQTNQL